MTGATSVTDPGELVGYREFRVIGTLAQRGR